MQSFSWAEFAFMDKPSCSTAVTLYSLNFAVQSPLSLWPFARYMFTRLFVYHVRCFGLVSVVPVTSASQGEQVGREKESLERAKLSETGCQGLQLMPDSRCVSHFVWSLAELWARVFSHLMPCHLTRLERHACMCIRRVPVHQGVTSSTQTQTL